MGGLPLDGAMEAVAQEIAERVRGAPMVRIVTHIDTDGITGGAIASEALDRAGIAHEVAFVKKLDEPVITELKRRGTPLVWFIDLGAGMMHALHGLDAVITDHHVPTERESEGAAERPPPIRGIPGPDPHAQPAPRGSGLRRRERRRLRLCGREGPGSG